MIKHLRLKITTPRGSTHFFIRRPDGRAHLFTPSGTAYATSNLFGVHSMEAEFALEDALTAEDAIAKIAPLLHGDYKIEEHRP